VPDGRNSKKLSQNFFWVNFNVYLPPDMIGLIETALEQKTNKKFYLPPFRSALVFNVDNTTFASKKTFYSAPIFKRCWILTNGKALSCNKKKMILIKV